MNVYVPSAKLVNSMGLVQGSIVPPPVIVHTKWSTSSVGLPENVKVIESDGVVPSSSTELSSPSVAESMLVSGGVVSTVHVNESGSGSSFPAKSTAATVNVYSPSANSLNI